MTSYYVDVGEFLPMTMPVPDLETGYAVCAEIYKSGMKKVRLIKIGDTLRRPRRYRFDRISQQGR